MFTTTEIKQIKELLATPKNICIVSHRNPDGDAVGSSLALLHFLKQFNHTVTYISPNEVPNYLAWLPSTENIISFEDNAKKATELLENSDIIFTLDFNAFHRTGDTMEKIISQLNKLFILIDHHQLPDNYATYMFSDTSYGSTAEMIYNFIVALGYKKQINKTIGTCIYTGIVTDSGGFKFPKTTAKTHQCVAYLIECGINNPEIHQLLFDNTNYSRLQILGRALENLKLLPEYKAAYTTLSNNELNEFNYQKGDTEDIVNYGLSLKGITLAAIFIENKDDNNTIKISFRSQGNIDVNQFARKYFNGGGHINAAGGKSFSSLKETVQQFITILAEENF